MEGIFRKFTEAFQKGYKLGWDEYDDDMDGFGEGDEGMYGRHTHAMMNGLYAFGGILAKSGMEFAIADPCGCGDPLHEAVCFRRPGDSLVMAAWVFEGLWRNQGSMDLYVDFCQGLADGSESLGDADWGISELGDMDEERWEYLCSGGGG